MEKEPTEYMDDNQTASAGKFSLCSCTDTYMLFRFHSHNALWYKISILLLKIYLLSCNWKQEYNDKLNWLFVVIQCMVSKPGQKKLVTVCKCYYCKKLLIHNVYLICTKPKCWNTNIFGIYYTCILVHSLCTVLFFVHTSMFK